MLLKWKKGFDQSKVCTEEIISLVVSHNCPILEEGINIFVFSTHFGILKFKSVDWNFD